MRLRCELSFFFFVLFLKKKKFLFSVYGQKYIRSRGRRLSRRRRDQSGHAAPGAQARAPSPRQGTSSGRNPCKSGNREVWGFFFFRFFFLYLFLFVFVVFCFVLFCRRSRAGRASRVCHARVARTPRARLRSPAPSTMHRWGGRAGRGLGPFSGRGASPRPGWGPLGQEGRGRGRGHAPPSAARREVGRGQARRGSPRPGSQALGHLVPLAGLPSPARRGGGAGGAGVPHLVF